MASYKELESAILVESRSYGGITQMEPEDAWNLIEDVLEQRGAYNRDNDEVTYYENLDGNRRIFKMSLDDFACFFLG